MNIEDSLPGYREPSTTLEKLMVLIQLLKYKRRMHYYELASILDKSDRQVRRDVKMLERFFLLDYDDKGRPFILTDVNDDEIVVNLTSEEMAYIASLVKKSRSKFREGVIKKMDLNLQFDFQENTDFAKKIDDLEQGINSGSRVMLKAYASANSKTVRDIEVEPIIITEFKYLTAFDIKDEKVKVFSIDRIEKVDLSGDPFLFKAQHQQLKPDPFGMASGEAHAVDLLLSERAYLLMREEYPRTRLHLTKSESTDYPWRFYSTVYGLEGIGRFVLGLAGETQLVAPAALRAYIIQKIDQISV